MKTVKYYIPLFSLLSIALSSCNSTAEPAPPPQSLTNHVAETIKHQVEKKVQKAADKVEEALKPKGSSTESSSSADLNNPTITD